MLEHNDKLVVLGVDPIGSILARPESLNVLKEGESPFYKVEGTGYDFIPLALNHKVVSHWVKSNDDDSFACTRRLIRVEGLLCGGSSGASVASCLKFLRETEDGQKIARDPKANVVIVLPDS